MRSSRSLAPWTKCKANGTPTSAASRQRFPRAMSGSSNTGNFLNRHTLRLNRDTLPQARPGGELSSAKSSGVGPMP